MKNFQNKNKIRFQL